MQGKHPFDYHAPTPKMVAQIKMVRDGCKMLYGVLQTLPPGRELSLAITKLEEVSMWANKGIVMSPEEAPLLESGVLAISPE